MFETKLVKLVFQPGPLAHHVLDDLAVVLGVSMAALAATMASRLTL